MFEELKSTFGGKKVFLTGHTGFKGAWMLKMLHMLGAEIRGYSLAPQTAQDLYHVIDGDSLCDSVIADLRDGDRLKAEVSSFNPDFVFHLAAQPLVRLSYESPSETFEVNAIGTANLLDAVRLVPGVCSVILITTDKVYYNNEWDHPYRENDRLGGYDPYSASKACAELVIDSYRNSFFNRHNYAVHRKAIAVARAGNVIGGGDWSKDRLVPDIVRAISKGEKVVIRNPASIRPWQHVLEPLGGYLLLARRLSEEPSAFSDAYNFGPELMDALPVKKMVEFAISSWGSGDFEMQSSGTNPHEAGLLKLDISKAVARLHWKPKYNAPTAIAKTIDWYRQYIADPAAASDFTLAQISEYFDVS